MLKNTLYVVIPCYNEEEVLNETAGRLLQKFHDLIGFGKIAENSRIVFVNDGSADGTWGLIEDLCRRDNLFSGVNLSRNRGHQNALLAGLMTVRELADMTISMDADLQDDIGAVDEMVDRYLEGCDIVYGVRKSRDRDTFFKRFTAEGYYRLLKRMGCDVVFNHADYRLMSRRALDALAKFGEQNLFLRGVVPMLGYRTATVQYERGERFAGESKYPLKKMLALAADGVTSLSLKPVRMIMGLGILLLVLSGLFLIFSLVTLFMGYDILNWKIILVSVWGACGLILLALGVGRRICGQGIYGDEEEAQVSCGAVYQPPVAPPEARRELTNKMADARLVSAKRSQ